MSVDTTLQHAMAAHQSGRLEEAAKGYQDVLSARPEDPDALHFLGLLRLQCGAPEEALQLIGKSLQHAPQNPHALNNFANLLMLADRPADAREVYRRVISVAPEKSEAYYNLALILRDEGEYAEALQYLKQAIERSPNFLRAYETLATLCYRLGDVRGAAETYRVWSLRDPGNSKARHMAAATSGINVPERASEDYIKLVYDHVAKGFDRNLAHLGYRAPEVVATALAEHAHDKLAVLDAGCGTGLCGPLIRSHCRELVGVDLSAKMLELAGKRAAYDELVPAELCDYMRSHANRFEAVISADTLIYFGALETVFTAAATTLRPGGLLLTTFEALRDAGTDSYRLEVHGRYAHREAYLRETLTNAGFEVVRLGSETLRQERLQDVPGFLVVARKVGGSSAS